MDDLILLTSQPLLPLCLWSQPQACQARELQSGPCPLFHFSSIDIVHNPLKYYIRHSRKQKSKIFKTITRYSISLTN